MKKPDFNEAMKWWLKAAENGNADAQNRIAFIYSDREIGELDHKKSVKWYRKAAEQGHESAIVTLGRMYRDGAGGVKEDHKEAAKWLLKAAENGDLQSQGNIARMYENGLGVKKDMVTAYAWMRILSHKIWITRYAKKMTPEQITKAEELAKEMLKKNPKLIKK